MGRASRPGRRDFFAARPDGIWLSDFTCIRTWEGWSYAAAVLGVFTGRIVGWQMASRMRQPLVSDALEMAESIMSTLRRELTRRCTWRTRLGLELALVTCIGWCNARRKHRSLKTVEDGRARRLSPQQALERCNQEVATMLVASK